MRDYFGESDLQCKGIDKINELKKQLIDKENEIIYLREKLKNEMQKREQSENTLKEIKNAEEIILSSIPDSVCYIDASGRWIYANDIAEKSLELGNNYRGKTNKELGEVNSFLKDTYNYFDQCHNRAWKSRSILREEDSIPQRDGSVKIFDTVKVPFFNKDKSGNGILIIARDITTQKEAELRLKQSEERYKRLVDVMPEAIYVLDENGKNIFSNKAGARLAGVDNPKELIGMDYRRFLSRDYHKISQEKFSKLISNKINKSIRLERKFVTINGDLIDVECNCIKYKFEDKDAILIVVRDVTEKKKNEELKIRVEEKTKQLNEIVEHDKVKTEFFSNISHELKTPVNVIFSAIQIVEMILREHKCKNKCITGKYIYTMKQNCYRLTRLINNILDISKIDSGYCKLTMENVDIVNLIESITLSVVEYAKSKEISIIFDTDVEEKIMAVDVDKIERVILNLLSNAIKFTGKEGNILVSIKNDDNHIMVSVKDDGIGIPEEKQKSIFERFIQVDKSLSRNNEGSGIGLSLVKSLVEMHGGDIGVKSDLGKGSEFSVKIPVVDIDKEESEMKYNDVNIERIGIEFSDIYFN
ncbi:PAS domain S-box-containing protein [Clostridium pascui]|uniref:PAS domain-containing sensor histidine kinase n=1 Tax=Clostridium pascui TaxID=46609 RepID=UPI001959663A|nr:PAS domain-containing sensor histidine kinase [Clostridium pascui]MBM7870781.1 PAS domain S-box-containing protein [Clostridium pascui]